MTYYSATPGNPADGITLNNGDYLSVVSGGTASATTVNSGGTVHVASGGVASDTTINSDGSLINAGGADIGTVVSGGAAYTVLSGGTASGAVLTGSTVSGTGTNGFSGQFVNAGGTTVSTVVESNGGEALSFGAVASNTFIGSQGQDAVYGSTVDTMVGYFGVENIYSGGFTTGTVVSSGGTESVYSGGVASGTVLNSGAELDVTYLPYISYVGGDSASVDSNDLLTVTVGGAGGSSYTQHLSGNYTSYSFQVSVDSAKNGTLVTVVSSATSTLGGNPSMSGVLVYSGGTLVSSSSGTLSGAVISAGETEYVYQGGIAVSSLISSGGSAFVSSGGAASGTFVSSGGFQYVYTNGTDTGTVVSSGGIENVSSGGTTVGTEVFGTENVYFSGVASASILENGAPIHIALQTVYSGGITISTVVGAFDEVVVSSGGMEDNTMIDGIGTFVFIDSGGVASGTFDEGGDEAVEYGGVASGTTVSGSFAAQSVLGNSFGTVVIRGGKQYVIDGGTASGTVVSSGGLAILSAGGVGSSIIVNSGGTEQIVSGGVASGTVLSSGGQIDITYLSYVSGGSAGVDSNDLLTVTEGGSAASYTQYLSGDYTNEYFHTTLDSSGSGTLVTVNGMPCYCRGTRVLTDHGEVSVENLRIGDCLVTRLGAAHPLIWIGRRSYTGRFAAANREVLPVKIRAGALAENTPTRDLFVSPLHAMYLDDVLIPASALVNGTSILQVEAVDEVEYFHLELETHDVILAEGALSESFVDDDSRGMFHNAAEYRILYPDAPRLPARYCAPRVEDGEILEAVRRRLAAMTLPAQEVAAAPEGQLMGHLDQVGREKIRGWAWDPTSPDHPVRLRVLDNATAIGNVVADIYRADLEKAGIGSEKHSFEFVVPGGLSPLSNHVIHVQRASDGKGLTNSPLLIDGAPEAASASVPLTIQTKAIGTIRGFLDVVTRERVAGWAHDDSAPGEAVALQILDNGNVIARVLANRHRPDLEKAGFGSGRHSFDISIPGGLSPLARHVIEVKREQDGAALGSPTVIEPVNSFDATLKRTIANAVGALGTGGEQEHVLSFVLAQAERLLQQRADSDASRAKRLQYRQFRRRWGPQAADATEVADPGLRALVVDTRVPDPRRDGGSNAVLSHVRTLQRLGYAVSFVAAGEMGQSAPELAGEGVTLCSVPFYSSVEDVLRRQADCFDVVYLHRADIAARYLALARSFLPRARILYSVADLHHLRLDRQAAVEDRPELRAASRRMRLTEFTAAWSADAVITHSSAEADLLRQAVPEANVYQVPWDLTPRPSKVPLSDRRGVAFIGNYTHTPNEDAARWLVEAVMPLVWLAHPDMTLLLVGSDMTDIVRRLERPGVVPAGQVECLRTNVFDRVRLAVAPLRYGAGVKGKVLDSLAAGVPCVMSEVAAEGLQLPAILQSLVGRDPSALAALICRLHEDAAFHHEVAQAGLALIRQCHSTEAVAASLGTAIDGRRAKLEVSDLAASG